MNYLTYGGVTIGICLLVHQLVTWWPGYKALTKDPVKQASALLPFLLGWAYGCLTTLGVGGLVGLVSGTILGLSNWLGDVALVWGVGGQGGRTAAAVFVPLSGPGLGIVLILTVAFIAAAKKSKHGVTLKRGAWCGITLGTSAGVAGFAAVPLATAASIVGDRVYGAF
ncbi:hypothetical protein [Streptomyces soliscabiei]|uniref:hypothetical protein n=1 Tax=Streptomyces soliscabiei TaxID=588897 RepID=UPI0029A56B43|nr:hypothetical protein [Streptomyces sp. NY05-11A]MDX2679279.1 hypothetical protein [Streptomyces sp. NY05-11A]